MKISTKNLIILTVYQSIVVAVMLIQTVFGIQGLIHGDMALAIVALFGIAAASYALYCAARLR